MATPQQIRSGSAVPNHLSEALDSTTFRASRITCRGWVSKSVEFAPDAIRRVRLDIMSIIGESGLSAA